MSVRSGCSMRLHDRCRNDAADPLIRRSLKAWMSAARPHPDAKARLLAAAGGAAAYRSRDPDPHPMSALLSRAHAKPTLAPHAILPSPVRERRLGPEGIDGCLAY